MARAKLYGRVGKQIVAACVPRRAAQRGAAVVRLPALTRRAAAPAARSVKSGGPSENSNATLAAVLQIARLNNIPKARAATRVITCRAFSLLRPRR